MARPFEFQISFQKLILVLLCTVVPVSLAALYASSRIGRHAEDAALQNLQTVAKSIASHTRESIRSQVIAAAMVASDAAVLEAVQASNRQYGLGQDENRSQVKSRDSIWNTPAGRDLVERTLTNPASESLRRKLSVHPYFLRITVTDREGATVAASHKTIDYDQADEEYWQDIYASGRGAVSLTDILYDDASQSYYLGVGVPVVDEANTLIGTLDALVDVAALFPLVYETGLGPGGVASIVKSNGTVIASSRGASFAERSISPEYQAVIDAKESFRGRASGSLRAAFPSRDYLIAFADTGLKDEFGQLDWATVVSEDATALLGDSSGPQMLIMAIALLSLALVIFVIVYFEMHRQSEIDEIEEEMHGSLRD